jgi:cytochrome P450
MINQANGADWQRQRKITSTPFNEQNSHLVWIEALRQADEVLQSWKSSGTPITRTAKDTRTLSLHVLSGAGFGKSYSFHKSTGPPKPGHVFNYRDSLALILENIFLILIFGPKFLTNRFLPKSWTRIGQATADFKFHMVKMVEEEKQLIAKGKPGGGNIINSLIRASEEVSKSPTGAGGEHSFRGLTENEVYGNIFVYNFAGHDTMAITLNWALYLLAAYPDIQDWISEEINTVIPNDQSSTWTYSEAYPKLNRCLAVLVSNVILLPFHSILLPFPSPPG